jgi:site-specific DNA recombinase
MPRSFVVAIYARISLDRTDGEGVARQLADGRQLAADRWPDAQVVEYVDNDVSAFRARRRPEFERLLTDLSAGRINAVVAYHPDRLYRRLADLEAFIDATQVAGADVATVKAGDIDMSSASNRMVARILGSVARHESERIGERVSRAKQERAAQGRASGGGKRPFGLSCSNPVPDDPERGCRVPGCAHDGRMTLVPGEAVELRQVAAARLGGASWRSEVVRLQEAGVMSTTGRPWTIGTLRRTITSPYVAGLRAYKGEIVGPAAWPAILDRETWDQLRADKAASHPGRPFVAKYLLSGLLTCSNCGQRLYATPLGRGGRVNYRCATTQSTKGRGCGKIHIAAGVVEPHVLAEVREWLIDPVFAEELDAFLAYGDADAGRARARTDLEEIERRQKVLARRWAAGELSDAEY